MATTLQLLARHVAPTAAADAALLDRFTRSRDHEAFAALVQRHGPIVYRICRRLVGSAAADDAFQATFLLLATRSAAALAASSVGGWLMGVAGRVARQIRRSARRRAGHEAIAANRNPREIDHGPDLRDQFYILDEELSRLPDHLRGPLVSCLLQGQTQEEAAATSGLAARTIRRRLEEAKRVLRLRLQRRGVTPAVAVGLVAGLGSVSPAIPAGLVVGTVELVFDFLTGGATVASPPVILAKGVAMTMLARKVMAAMVAMAVGVTGLGMVLAQTPTTAPNTAHPSAGAGQPAPDKPGSQPGGPPKPEPNPLVG